MKRKTILLITKGAFILILPLMAWAIIPPPPVNQELGRFDTRFNNLTEPECRFCHNQNPPDGIPVDPTYLPDRHHLLVGTDISAPSVVPYPDSDGDQVNDTIYDCYNCHNVLWDGSAFVMDPNFRNCMVCHRQLFGDHHGYSPHHSTPLAQADLDNDGVRDTNTQGEPVTYCSECHGSLVTDLGDGHTIPTYDPSLVTPWRSQKVNGDSTRVNIRGTEAGNCNFCHDSGIAEDGREVVDNMLSHHGAGFYQGYMGSGPCYWCHYDYPNTSPTIRSEFDIRTCEGCHGFESLHNIQLDSDGDDEISPGAEMASYGHIGSNDDCHGCHGFLPSASAAPASGPVVPDIHTYSPSVIVTGQDRVVTITGVAFTNIAEGPEGPVTLTSEITLEARDGTVLTLTPETITQSVIEVIIPGSLQPGNYSLRAQKGTKISSKNVLVVKPPVVISGVSCDKKKGIMAIAGSGFSDMMYEAASYIHVMVNGVPVNPADFVLWKDSEIKFGTSRCQNDPEITVKTLFGSAAFGGGGGKPSKPCRGKKC